MRARDPGPSGTLEDPKIFEPRSLVLSLELGGPGDTGRHGRLANRVLSGTDQHEPTPGKPPDLNYTIFEGTSEIQRLVIARAISGMRIE